MIRYYINGKDIEQYGVYVVGQSGMLSPLRAKERESVSLSNAHGRIYDTTKTYYEERVITGGITGFACRLFGHYTH